jgi:hypothetical protein
MMVMVWFAGCDDIVLAARGQPSVFNGFKDKPRPAPEPGFYGFSTQWNYGRDDISGEMGHPVDVDGPRARCVPGDWRGRTTIVSGKLPDGLALEAGDNIKGIPTKRGHWIVTLRLDDITCNGVRYERSSFEQQLRFHITGTGEVIK